MTLYPIEARAKIRRLATGRLISVTGGAAAYTALNYTVWTRTHSPGMQALSLLLTFGVAGVVGAFGSALAEIPCITTSRAAIPNLVEDEDDVSWANSLVTMGVHAGIAVGPLVGGVLVATAGASWVFGLNALTFLVSIGLTITVRGSYQESRDTDE